MTTLSTVNVKITGDTGQLVSSLTVAEKRVTAFSSHITGLGNAASTQARGFSNLARGFTNAAGQSGVLNSEISILASSVGNVGLAAAGAGIGFGLLIGGIGASIASAIGFETAITRVAKTANLSAEETKAFGGEILNMSRRLPIATSELTAIAEVAGQLGISGAGNLATFTEEIAKLSTTTGLAGAELASSLGLITQVFNLPIENVKNLSAEITDLGNTMNSTESEILAVASRVAGVGAALGVPIADILSLSSLAASVTGDVEATGSALQRTFLAIHEASSIGGDADKLQLFADVARLTTDEFTNLAKADPGVAFAKFAEGLRGVENVEQVLKALDLNDVRITKTLLAIAQSSLTASDAVNNGRRAAEQATATDAEFGRQAETTAAKIQLLKNNIGATAVDFGTLFIPAVKGGLDGLVALTGAIEKFGPGALEVAALSAQALGEAIADAGRLAHDSLGPGVLGDLPGLLADSVTSVDALKGASADLAIGFAFLFPEAALVVGILGVIATFAVLDSDVKTASDSALGFELAWLTAVDHILDAFVRLEDGMLEVATFGLSNLFDFGDTAASNAQAANNLKRGELQTEIARRSADRIPGGAGAPSSTRDFSRSIHNDTPGTSPAPTDRRTLHTPGGGGGSAPHVLTALEAAMDGVITRTEALTLGLSDQEVIMLESAVAANKVADAEFRNRIGLEALAQAYPGLTGAQVQLVIGLQAIAEHLRLTGDSIEKFILETSTAALDGFKSAFDAIFNKPTKEDSGLHRQLLEAQRKKLLAPGASDAQNKVFDAAIKNIQNLIDVRRNADELKKVDAELADATAQSDKDQATAADLYIAAIADSSKKVQDNTGIVFLQTIAGIGLKNTTLDTTTAIQKLGDAAANATYKIGAPGTAAVGGAAAVGSPEFILALQQLAFLRDLPSLDSGGVALSSGAAMIQKGERFYNGNSGPRGESGQPVNITSYITVEGDATERTVAMIKQAVRDESEAALRRASFRGSYVTSGAYTPS
jgi:TP901 family phage tail tape measure protein